VLLGGDNKAMLPAAVRGLARPQSQIIYHGGEQFVKQWQQQMMDQDACQHTVHAVGTRFVVAVSIAADAAAAA
jgi:hypothetical protein